MLMKMLLGRLLAVALLLCCFHQSSFAGDFPGKGSYNSWLRANDSYNQARELGNAGRYADAVASFDRAIGFYPYDAFYYYNRGINQAKLEQVKAAESSYRQAIALNPNMYQAWQGLAVIVGNQDRDREAISCFQKA